MDVPVRLVDLTLMHPSLLWEDIVAATMAVLGETRAPAPFSFALTVQDVPGFGNEQTAGLGRA